MNPFRSNAEPECKVADLSTKAPKVVRTWQISSWDGKFVVASVANSEAELVIEVSSVADSECLIMSREEFLAIAEAVRSA